MAVARRHGVRVDEPEVLADRANVVVHLRPAPLVAKVAATTRLVREPAAWLDRELRVAAYLGGAGVPVVVASDLVPAAVHRENGRDLTFWERLPHDADAQVEPQVLGGLLAELHVALRSCPVPLGRLATPLEDVGRFLDRADPRSTAAMAAAFERIVRDLPVDAGQALHGDPHPGNLLRAQDGWVWADLEDACSGPVGWDLACLDGSNRIDGPAALRAYGDLPDLRSWRELRALHATAWSCLYAERLPRHRVEAEARLASWG